MATENITICGRSFDIPVPTRYEVGSQITLTEGEASSIAQTFCENVRNNIAGKMKKSEYKSGDMQLMVAADGTLPEEAVAQWQPVVTAYAEQYEFGVRAVGGGRVSYDPETREALGLIRPDIRKALVKKYGAKHGRTAEQVTEAALRLLETPKGERYRRMAKQILRQKQDVAGDLLEGLDEAAD